MSLFDPHLFFGDLDQLAWYRLLDLERLTRPRSGQTPRRHGRKPAPLLVLHDGRCVVRMLQHRAPVAGGAGAAIPQDLERLRRERNASLVILAHVEGFNRLMDRVQERFPGDGDIWDFAMLVLRCLIDEGEAMGVVIHPLPENLRWLFAGQGFERWFRRVWPDNSTVTLMVLGHDRVEAALVLGKREGRIALITSHLHFTGGPPPVLTPSAVAAWLNPAIESAGWRPGLGAFTTLEFLRQARAARVPAVALAQGIAMRRLVLTAGHTGAIRTAVRRWRG
ncbi:MAG: hypothetical protein GMKNLPBB_01261 [Myxococcota bacterium]|nr:hypothetical protein [Myxococcota bacterium]